MSATHVATWAIIATVTGAFLGAVALLIIEEFHAARVARLRQLWRDRG